ncbi:conserved hypothetical protein [Burkholderia pseudomallei MSHR346]|nr:conserved hypothetical protein [Burkholderia pseudomallei MSHR346]
MNVPAASGGPAARLPGPLAQAVARLRTADGDATDVLTRQTPRQHHSSEGIGVRPTAMPQRRERAPLHAERPRRGVFSRLLPFSAVFRRFPLRARIAPPRSGSACASGLRHWPVPPPSASRHRARDRRRRGPPSILRFVEPFSGRRSWPLANRHDRAQNH